MKRAITGLILFVLTAGLVLLHARLFANSTLAGNPVTVNRNSGVNALRNPALMSWQEYDSLGMAYIYSAQVFSGFDGSLDMGIADSEHIRADMTDIYKGSALLSYVKRMDRHSFGAGISNNDGTQFSVEENENSIGYYIAGIPNDIDAYEKTTTINTSLVLSYSYRYANRHSLGFQFETGYFRKSSEKEETTYTNWVLQEKTESDIETERFYGSFAIGYFYSGRFFEAGLMCRGGQFSKETTEVSYNQAVSALSGSMDISQDIKQTGGYGIIAGIGRRWSSRLLLNIEAGVELPLDFTRSRISDSFTEVDSDIDIYTGYLFRIGADYRISGNFSTGIGGSFHFRGSREEGPASGKTTTSSTRFFEVITGLEYRFSRDVMLILACDLFYLQMESSMEGVSPVMTLDMNSDMVYTNIIAGITVYF